MTQYILKGNNLGYNTAIFFGLIPPPFSTINDSGVREMLNGEKITLSPISCTLYLILLHHFLCKRIIINTVSHGYI